MNQHILIAMDCKNRSKEELYKNYSAAWDAFEDAAFFADAGCSLVAEAAANAAHAASLVSPSPANAEFNAAKVEHYLNLFFRFPGENREDYEKTLKEMRE